MEVSSQEQDEHWFKGQEHNPDSCFSALSKVLLSEMHIEKFHTKFFAE